jgi:hypothetical protein
VTLVAPLLFPKIQKYKSLCVFDVLTLFVNIVVLTGMVLERVVDHRTGNSSNCGLTCRIVEKYLACDYEARRVMEMMYGEKVLKKLVELFEREKENEIASDKFIRENTVSFQHTKYTDNRPLVQHVMQHFKKAQDVIK